MRHQAALGHASSDGFVRPSRMSTAPSTPATSVPLAAAPQQHCRDEDEHPAYREAE